MSNRSQIQCDWSDVGSATTETISILSNCYMPCRVWSIAFHARDAAFHAVKADAAANQHELRHEDDELRQAVEHGRANELRPKSQQDDAKISC